MRKLLALALATLAGLSLGPQPAAAASSDLDPGFLRPSAAARSWQPTIGFHFHWEPTPLHLPPPVAADYRIFASDGSEVFALPWQPLTLDRLRVVVPSTPDRYTAWIRLSDGTEWGPWGSLDLRFDDTRPGLARPLPAAGWMAPDQARVEIDRPPDPLPPSGIHGYALSVDSPPGTSPCADPDLCRESELTRAGGIEANEVRLPHVPEGVHRVQAVAVSGAGVPSAEIGAATIRIDGTAPEVELAGLPERWARGPVRLRASAADRLSGMAATGPQGPFTAIAVDRAPPRVMAGGTVTATVSGDGVHEVAYYGRDAAGNVGDGLAGSTPPRTALVRIDGEPPRPTFDLGRDPADPEQIAVTVRDRLSGPAARGSIAVRPLGGGRSFEPLPTVATAGRLVARWNSDAAPAGNYEFRATAYDRAGNSADGFARADGAKMVLASPLKAVTSLRLGFGGRRMTWHRCVKRASGRRCRRVTVRALDRRPTTRSMPAGRRVPVSGLLRGPDGAPLAGRRVAVVETMDDGARRTTVARTRPDGRFLVRLAPGPNRVVEARFGGDRVLAASSGRRLRLLVPTAVRMRASRESARVGGAPVRFVGRVTAGRDRVPRAGLSVELQFRLPGLPWSEFRTVRTDRRGRFRLPYAFSDDDSRGVRFLFRAHVPAQAGWAYAPGSSLPVTVTGR